MAVCAAGLCSLSGFRAACVCSVAFCGGFVMAFMPHEEGGINAAFGVVRRRGDSLLFFGRFCGKEDDGARRLRCWLLGLRSCPRWDCESCGKRWLRWRRGGGGGLEGIRGVSGRFF
jgi:hypothetical protein